MTEQFYHVYELPDRDKLAPGYAFNGGNPVPFLNVDWFGGPPPSMGEMGPEDIEAFVRQKRYIKPGKRYLVLGSPGHTFVMEPKP